jgi:hypothetical protein
LNPDEELLAAWERLSERVEEEKEEALSALAVQLWGRATVALLGRNSSAVLTEQALVNCITGDGSSKWRMLLGESSAPEACHSALVSLRSTVHALKAREDAADAEVPDRVTRAVWKAHGESTLSLLRNNRCYSARPNQAGCTRSPQ